MGWFRRKPDSPSEGDLALREAQGRREYIHQRAEDLEPLLKRLEARKRDNFIAEAVEETLRRDT